jgi:hypothetical protein
MYSALGSATVCDLVNMTRVRKFGFLQINRNHVCQGFTGVWWSYQHNGFPNITLQASNVHKSQAIAAECPGSAVITPSIDDLWELQLLGNEGKVSRSNIRIVPDESPLIKVLPSGEQARVCFCLVGGFDVSLQRVQKICSPAS